MFCRAKSEEELTLDTNPSHLYFGGIPFHITRRGNPCCRFR